MKSNIYNYLLYFIISVLLSTSCDEFLDKTPEADVIDEDVFGTYESYQGFLDPNYPDLMDYNKTYLGYTLYMGGEAITPYKTVPSTRANRGEYWGIIEPSLVSHYFQTDAGKRGYGVNVDKSFGIWRGGWRGIRRSNEALQYLDLLLGTQEEKDLIEGQALFFRAYFHGDIMKSFGGMPYVDTVFAASDEMKLPRLTYQECTEEVVRDLDRAIELLPEDWDLTGPGSQRVGANRGRITKGAALAYKQKYLLYAGSPLMNGFSGNDFVYNVDYCKRAAAAGWEMIKLANKGLYSLLPMANYSRNFHNSNDRTTVWSTETILQRPDYRFGSTYSYYPMRVQFLPVYLGGANIFVQTANQLIVDRFEMADGTRYKEEYDQDDDKRWKNRDPRFYANFYLDREKLGANAKSVAKLYISSETESRPANNCLTPYLIKKFVGYNANNFDRASSNYQIACPLMRLAQVYLDYAEAVTAAYGPEGSAPGSNLTAVDAINIIRARAGMPPVTAAAEGYDSFMDLVRNERIIELLYEHHYWFDIRRWYVAHLPEYKNIVTLDFDKDWTYFNRTILVTRVFDNPKHYWLPIYKDQVQLYEGFYQNPGWE